MRAWGGLPLYLAEVLACLGHGGNLTVVDELIEVLGPDPNLAAEAVMPEAAPCGQPSDSAAETPRAVATASTSSHSASTDELRVLLMVTSLTGDGGVAMDYDLQYPRLRALSGKS